MKRTWFWIGVLALVGVGVGVGCGAEGDTGSVEQAANPGAEPCDDAFLCTGTGQVFGASAPAGYCLIAFNRAKSACLAQLHFGKLRRDTSIATAVIGLDHAGRAPHAL
jgi:hypothetical protein